MRIKKIRLIFILVILMTGLSITGWTISTHYDHTILTDEIQRELDNDRQISNELSTEFSNNSPILFLISTGLIGLLGVRRQKNRIGSFQSNEELQ